MSVTVRLWDDKELKRAHSDKWLATLLMNRKTFNKKEWCIFEALPFDKREFICYWDNKEGEEVETIYAPDIRMLKQFILADYTHLPDHILERKIKHVEVTI